MTSDELRELGVAIAMCKHYEEVVEKAKDKIREMTEEEIEQINEGIFLNIARKDYIQTTYSSEYKQELKKLQEKFPPEKTTKHNHTITLNATSYSTSKANIIINEIATKNKTTIQAIAKSASKVNNKTK